MNKVKERPAGESGARPDSKAGLDPKVGLCSACLHARRIRSDRGSLFYLCERSRTDPTFAMYPRLPVVACGGFEPAPGAVQTPV